MTYMEGVEPFHYLHKETILKIATLALLAVLAIGIGVSKAREAHAYTCTTTCNYYSCTTNCW